MQPRYITTMNQYTITIATTRQIPSHLIQILKTNTRRCQITEVNFQSSVTASQQKSYPLCDKYLLILFEFSSKPRTLKITLHWSHWVALCILSRLRVHFFYLFIYSITKYLKFLCSNKRSSFHKRRLL